MDLIAAEGIEKRFGQLTALRDISLRVRRGELYGLIGPDGAGKTTFFRILTTLMPPDGGRATVDGLDIATDYRRIRAAVGYMPGRFSLYPDLTVKENLESLPPCLEHVSKTITTSSATFMSRSSRSAADAQAVYLGA